MVSRGRIGGRHFALMKAVLAGEARGHPSSEMNDLIRWGYVTQDGDGYGATPEGERVFQTWQNMKDPGL